MRRGRPALDRRAWLAYGDVLVELEKYPDANVAYRACSTRPIRSGRRIEEATAALVADERRKTAEEMFREILKADPSHVAALCGLAALRLTCRSSDRGRAAAAPRFAAVRLPAAGLPRAWACAGRGSGASRRREAAVRYLVKIEPENPKPGWRSPPSPRECCDRRRRSTPIERAALLNPEKCGCGSPPGTCRKPWAGAPRARRPTRRRSRWIRPEPRPSGASRTSRIMSSATRRSPRCSALLSSGKQRRSNEAHLQFALGKAFEQRAAYAQAFEHYAAGNALRRLDEPFDIEVFEGAAHAFARSSTPHFFAAHRGSGQPESRADLHRRPAALRLDAGRADPRQSLAASRAPWSCRIS